MKFDTNGNRIGTKSKAEDALKAPYTIRPTPFTGRYAFEVDADNVKGGWGVALPSVVRVDVKAIAYNVSKFFAWKPDSFPLVESITEAISDTSVNELIQREGEIDVGKYSSYTPMDLDEIVADMGHPIRSKMYEATKPKPTNPRKVLHPHMVIELPEPIDNHFTIGNMTLTTRNS